MEVHCLVVLETGSSGSRQVLFPLRTARENFLHVCLLGSNSRGHSLARRRCSPRFSVCACVSVCAQMSPFHKDASHTGLGHTLIPHFNSITPVQTMFLFFIAVRTFVSCTYLLRDTQLKPEYSPKDLLDKTWLP